MKERRELYSYVIGLMQEEAESRLSHDQVRYRISAIDDLPMILTCDYVPSRLNLTIKNGIVTDIDFG